MILANRHSRRLFGSTIVAKTFTVIVVVIIITGFCDNKKAFTFNVSGNTYLRISPLTKNNCAISNWSSRCCHIWKSCGGPFSRQPSGGLFSLPYRRSHPIFWPPVILISSQLRGGHHRIWHCLTIFTVNFRFSSINNYHDRQNKTAQTIWKLFHVSKIISCFQSISNFYSDTTPVQWAVWTRPNLLWTVFFTTL